MLEFSVSAIIVGLREVARTIGQVIIEEHKKRAVEKDLERLYENIKFYYRKTRELQKGKGNAIKLAMTIEGDDLFFLYVTNEKAEKIVKALRIVAILTDRTKIIHLKRRKGIRYNYKTAKYDKNKIIFEILKCLEVAKNICIQQS